MHNILYHLCVWIFIGLFFSPSLGYKFHEGASLEHSRLSMKVCLINSVKRKSLHKLLTIY